MPLKKKGLYQGLDRIDVFTDTDFRDDKYSKHFQISGLPDELPIGKTAFTIRGSKYLARLSDIKVEVLINGIPNQSYPFPKDKSAHDDERVVYSEIVTDIKVAQHDGIPVTIEVYEDTPPGLAQVIIVGELRGVPKRWKGIYNVRWTKDIYITPTLFNDQKIRFKREPRISVRERNVFYRKFHWGDVKKVDTQWQVSRQHCENLNIASDERAMNMAIELFPRYVKKLKRQYGEDYLASKFLNGGKGYAVVWSENTHFTASEIHHGYTTGSFTKHMERFHNYTKTDGTKITNPFPPELGGTPGKGVLYIKPTKLYNQQIEDSGLDRIYIDDLWFQSSSYYPSKFTNKEQAEAFWTREYYDAYGSGVKEPFTASVISVYNDHIMLVSPAFTNNQLVTGSSMDSSSYNDPSDNRIYEPDSSLLGGTRTRGNMRLTVYESQSAWIPHATHSYGHNGDWGFTYQFPPSESLIDGSGGTTGSNDDDFPYDKSYSDIVINDMETYAGEVARFKVYAHRPAAEFSEPEMIYDGFNKPKNILTDYNNPPKYLEHFGAFAATKSIDLIGSGSTHEMWWMDKTSISSSRPVLYGTQSDWYLTRLSDTGSGGVNYQGAFSDWTIPAGGSHIGDTGSYWYPPPPTWWTTSDWGGEGGIQMQSGNEDGYPGSGSHGFPTGSEGKQDGMGNYFDWQSKYPAGEIINNLVHANSIKLQ